MKTKIIGVVICFLVSISAWSQCGHYAKTQVRMQSGLAVPFPTARICTEPASGTTCGPLANLFTDAACTNPAPNPMSGDIQGSIDFFSSSPSVHLQINGNGISQIDISYVSLFFVTGSGAAPAHQFVNSISGLGMIGFAQPSVTDLVEGFSGSGAVARVVSPSFTTPNIDAATGASLSLSGGTALTTTNQTGTGNLVLATSPSIASPTFTGTSIFTGDISSGNQTVGGTLGVTGAATLGKCKNIGSIRCVDPTNAAAWPGSDVGAWINSAIADLGSTGGIVMVEQGNYSSWSTSINADNTVGVQIVGMGGLTPGAATSTFMTYTGTGTPISAKSTNGFRLADIMFAWSNAAFTGPFVDTGHSTATDSSWVHIERCSFFKTGSGATANVVISLDKTINSWITDTILQSYLVGVRGAVDNTSYSNAIHLVRMHFGSSTMAVVTAHVQNPAGGWELSGTVEGGNGGAVVGFTAGAVVNGLGMDISHLWCGDYTGNPVQTMFTIGSGWHFHGNDCAGGGTNTTMFAPANSSSGFTITGNAVQSVGTFVAFATNNFNCDISGNSFSSVTSIFSGTPGTGCKTQDANSRTSTAGSKGTQTFQWSCSGVATAGSTLFLDTFASNKFTCTDTGSNGVALLPTDGTIGNLACIANVGGVNASSGVMTVTKNGVDQALTCTMGTGATCTDTNQAHNFAVTAGQFLRIKFTTQALETLNTITCAVEKF